MELIYRIDSLNRINFVSNGWSTAAATHGSNGLEEKKILGKNLWSFFEDQRVKDIYIRLIARARAGHTVRFKYRCDSASHRRFYTMDISGRPEGEVEFVTVLVREEPRPPVALLAPDSERVRERRLPICSWCQRVALPVSLWLPVEEAVRILRLLEEEKLPTLKPAICEGCKDLMEIQLSGGEPPGAN